MREFKKVAVDVSDIYNIDLGCFGDGKKIRLTPMQEQEIVDRLSFEARMIAQRNDLKKGEDINADLVYLIGDKEYSAICTITYDGRTLIVESGYNSERFDETWEEVDTLEP